MQRWSEMDLEKLLPLAIKIKFLELWTENMWKYIQGMFWINDKRSQ